MDQKIYTLIWIFIYLSFDIKNFFFSHHCPTGFETQPWPKRLSLSIDIFVFASSALLTPGLNQIGVAGGLPAQTNGTSLQSSAHSYNHSAQGGQSLPPLPPKKKPPAPIPPSGHTRNWSEPNASFLGHHRTPSDPPPSRPFPSNVENRNTVHVPVGKRWQKNNLVSSSQKRKKVTTLSICLFYFLFLFLTTPTHLSLLLLLTLSIRHCILQPTSTHKYTLLKLDTQRAWTRVSPFFLITI